MEIRVNSIICFVLMGIFLASCKPNEQKIDAFKLCSEFYELNKDMDFDGLFNVRIFGSRDSSKFNDSTLKYNRIPAFIGIYDSISKEHINLPSFSRNADRKEKRLFFARCSYSCIVYLENKYKMYSLFTRYEKEIEFIYSIYYKIKVPRVLPYTNIELIGEGNYIEFVLYKNEEKGIKYSCYYVADTLFSNDIRKNYINSLPKFDDHWCYEISEEK